MSSVTRLHLDYDFKKGVYYLISENEKYKYVTEIARRDIHPVLNAFMKTVERVERDHPEE